jgi:8-oxo-dGTP pyrophosphatase MutT (NUDIX family)
LLLLVHPTYKDTWDIPGGYVERGESPAAACRRELNEELGLDRKPLRLLAVDWAPSESEGDKLLFLFDCGPIDEEGEPIKVDNTEIDNWQWVAINRLDEYVIPRLAKRVRAAITVTPTYLEHGLPISPQQETR